MHCGRATTEGDDLYFEIRGNGPALLMIPGGGGDGGAFVAVAERLSDEFRVITFDRRGGGRSTFNHPDRFNVAQQGRDAAAIVRAAGEEKAFVLGNSSGAVIAIDMAVAQAQAVTAIVAHEPPLAQLHPDAAKWQYFFNSVERTWRRYGRTVAMLKFSFGIGFDMSFIGAVRAIRSARRAEAQSAERRVDRKKVIDYFLGQEMPAVVDYQPDLAALSAVRDKVVLAAGQKSLEKKRFYAEVAPILAERIGGEMAIFPGHHASFVDMPDAWAERLRHILRRFEIGTSNPERSPSPSLRLELGR